MSSLDYPWMVVDTLYSWVTLPGGLEPGYYAMGSLDWWMYVHVEDPSSDVTLLLYQLAQARPHNVLHFLVMYSCHVTCLVTRFLSSILLSSCITCGFTKLFIAKWCKDFVEPWRHCVACSKTVGGQLFQDTRSLKNEDPFYNIDGYCEDPVDDTWAILACHPFRIVLLICSWKCLPPQHLFTLVNVFLFFCFCPFFISVAVTTQELEIALTV